MLSRSVNFKGENSDSPLNSNLKTDPGGQGGPRSQTPDGMPATGGGPNSQSAVGGGGGPVSSSRPASTVQKGMSSAVSAKQGLEEGLLGTQMSLVNTLTRRCLAEGSKLLFVADVMAALKKYGEPWKDIFLDQVRRPVAWLLRVACGMPAEARNCIKDSAAGSFMPAVC